MGIIRGVTTNPTILFNDNVTGGLPAIKTRIKDIARLITPYPVSVEVTATERHQVIQQALEFASLDKNVIVKVTIHGPNGELENIEIIHELETQYHVRVNATAAMSAQQCFLAALAGASYTSIFAGRINTMGYNACGEISRLRKLLDLFDLNTKIIAGSTREVLNVLEWLEAGAHFIAVVPKILEGMLVHPYTKETVQMFLRDAAKG
jgi:transaldolase